MRDQIHSFGGCAGSADCSCFCADGNEPELTVGGSDLDPAIGRLSALSPAEQSVLDHALTGAPAREIADRLTLSEATVRSHLSRIYVKLGVSGRVALLAAFRDAELPDGAAAVQPSVHVPRPLQVVGWAWICIAALEVWFAAYLLSGVLGFGGSQENWFFLFVTSGLATVGFTVGRAILARPTRRHLLWGVVLAIAHLVVAGVMVPLGQPFFLITAPLAGLGWLSFRGWRQAKPGNP